jgi:hypothetical protein
MVLGENGTAFATDGSTIVSFDVNSGQVFWTFAPPGQITRINTEAKVVFIGSCFSGPAFESLWNVNGQTTGQAMIVLSNPSSTVPLGHAVAAWERILDDMVNRHMTVGEAVQEADTYLPTILDVQGQPISEQYRVIGDVNVKIKR